jgi:hypothetical protein
VKEPSVHGDGSALMSWKMAGRVKDILCGMRGEPITTTQKLVLLVLADSYNEDEGCAWPKVETLARQCLCDERSIQRSISHLCEVGLLSVEKSSGPGKANCYYPLPQGDIKSPTTKGVTPVSGKGVTPVSEIQNVSINEPIEEKIEPIARCLPLAKPVKRIKVKSVRSRSRFPQTTARTLNDFGPTPRLPQPEGVPPSTQSESRMELTAETRDLRSTPQLWKEMRKEFKSEIGKSLGNLSMRGGEMLREGVESHGTDAMWKGFNLWMQTEINFVGKLENPANRFVYHIDEWVSDAGTEKREKTKDDEDLNDGLDMTEADKEALRKYS